MIEPDRRKAIFILYREGIGIREIARRLRISRKTIQASIQQKDSVPVSIRMDNDPDRSRASPAPARALEANEP